MSQTKEDCGMTFQEVIGNMCGYLQRLTNSELSTFDAALRRYRPALPRGKGIYVFYEDCKPLYVGRSDRLNDRVLSHGRPSSGHNSATFAFILAKEKFQRLSDDVELPRSKERGDLEKDTRFKPLYHKAKRAVRNMGVRVVEIEDDIEQAIFEISAHMELDTPYNTFENH